jgi:CheY-like chemotaxis protein
MEAKPILLIVEDDLLVRMLAVEIAEDAGFSALEATDADSAICALQKGSDIRVVFTDIDMPGSMDGLELAVAIRHRWPPVQIVLTSGKMRPAADELPERSHFVPKPYDFSRLSGLFRELGGWKAA